MVDSYTLETELIEYLAEILRPIPPAQIHRGLVPEGVDTGLGLIVAGRQDTADYDARQQIRTAIIYGKFETRREALQFLDTLNCTFPRYGLKLRTAKCRSITIDDTEGESPRAATENGKRRWFASAALAVTAY